MSENSAMLDTARVIMSDLDDIHDFVEKSQAKFDKRGVEATAKELSDVETRKAIDALPSERSAALMTAFWDLEKLFSKFDGDRLEQMKSDLDMLEKIRVNFHAALDD